MWWLDRLGSSAVLLVVRGGLLARFWGVGRWE